MKKIIFLVICMGVSSVVFSQSVERLQGPKAKNHKPWYNKSKKSQKAVVYHKEKVQLKGPAYKNVKPWNVDRELQPIETLASEVKSLKGPAAKNLKPWEKSDFQNVAIRRNNKKVKSQIVEN